MVELACDQAIVFFLLSTSTLFIKNSITIDWPTK